MVMPDRMRWVYLDPQAQVQGPFTGLEMNDWYKAQFFTPDLRVKKVEDHDFEPLGQLIRRIGNSREPFLVPQVGIAHGPEKRLWHPELGVLTLQCQLLHDLDQAQVLLVLTATPGTESYEKLALLAVLGRQRMSG